MVTRRTFIAGVAYGLLVTPLTVVAQQAARVWHIGYLAAGPRPSDGAPPAVLRKALQDLGYVDGQNVTYVGRWAEAKAERLPSLAAELVGLKVDLIVAFAAKSALAAKQSTSTIPIVFVAGGTS